METEYWVLADQRGKPRSEYGVMGSPAACRSALKLHPPAGGEVLEPASLDTARAALVMLHDSSSRLAGVEDPDTGQRGIDPAGVAGLWWQDAMSRTADVLQAPSDGPREEKMLLELLETSRALSNATSDDGETYGIYQSGVEGLHFGSAYPGAKHVLGVDDQDLDRLTTKPDYVRLSPEPASRGAAPSPQASSVADAPEKNAVGSRSPRAGRTGAGAPTRPTPMTAYKQSRAASPDPIPRR